MKKLQRILEWVIAFLMFLSGRNVEKWRGKYEENRFDCDSLLGNERRPVFYGVRSGCLPSQAGIQRAGIPLLYPEGRADCVYPSGGEDRGACQGAQCDEYRYLLWRRAGREGPSQGYPDGGQVHSMRVLVKTLLKQYPGSRVCGHRDLSPDLNANGEIEPEEWIKQCPCFNVIEDKKLHWCFRIDYESPKGLIKLTLLAVCFSWNKCNK